MKKITKSKMQPFLVRERIITIIRNFFYSRNFHEVIIPVLNTAVPLEPNIYPFSTVWNNEQKKKTLYLSTSPERRLKHMIALGYKNCFGIGHSFRNIENQGPLHTPEFLMLEWYCHGKTYIDIMNQTKELLKTIEKAVSQNHTPIIHTKKPWKTLSLNELFLRYLKISLTNLLSDEKKIFRLAEKKGYSTKNATWEQLYDQLFVNEVESHLPPEPVFLVDFPSRISPLCKPKKENALFAERFELYIGNTEVANGNTEYTDTNSILRVFSKEHSKIKGKIPQPIDKVFIQSINKMRNTPYAGIGLGIDRLTLLYTQSSLKDFRMLV